MCTICSFPFDQQYLLRNLSAFNKRTNLNTPLEVRVLHERAVAQLALEELVHCGLKQTLEQDVKVAEVLERLIRVCRVQVGQLAERTDAVDDVALGDLQREVVQCAVAATSVLTLQHRDHLRSPMCKCVQTLIFGCILFK